MDPPISSPPPSSWPCPSCGLPLADEVQFCPRCGARDKSRRIGVGRIVAAVILGLVAVAVGGFGGCSLIFAVGSFASGGQGPDPLAEELLMWGMTASGGSALLVWVIFHLLKRKKERRKL